MAAADGTPQTPRPPSPGWALVASALVVFLLFVTLERAFAMVFVLNFSTGGPGPTVFLVLLFLSAFAYPLGLHRRWPHSRFFLDAGLVLFANLVLVSLFPHPVIAALAALLAFVVATPLVFALIAHLRSRFVEGTVLGILIHQAGRAWLDTAPYAALASGWIWTTMATIALFAVWVLLVRPGLASADRAQDALPRPHLFTPFLFLFYVHLGQPVVVARWHDLALLPLWGTGMVGLLLGLTALRLPRIDAAPLVMTSVVVFALGMLDLMLLGLAPLLSYPAAVATALHLFGVDTLHAGRRSIRRVGSETGILQASALFAVFLHAVAPSWAFLPPPISTLVHGRASVYLIVLGTLLVAGVFLVPFLRRGDAPPTRRIALPETPLILAVALALIVASGGLWVKEETPPMLLGPEPPIRVATYNIHQFFSTGKTGHYNLEAVAQVIEESGAEVIGLQETEGARVTSGNLDGVRWLAHRLDMHHAHGPPASHQMYGVAVLSKYPILDTSWIDLPAPTSVERAAMKAIIETPFGPMPVVVTHLQIEAFLLDRVEQVGALIDWTDGLDRVWILGDFNTTPRTTDAAYLLLTSRYTDAWVESGHRPLSGPTQVDSVVNERIDYIFLQGDWTVDDCHVYGDGRASDHRLVACDLTPADWPGETR